MADRRIFVLGSLNIDLVSVIGSDSRFPGPGETLRAKSFSSGFGGKGANQAVAAARLGSHQDATPRVAMVGAVGGDNFGIDFLAHLKREGIDTSGISVKDDFRTGTSVIIVEESTGENRILFSEAANGQVTVADIRTALSETTEAAIVILQNEIPIETVLQALELARSQGHETILNPAPAVKLPPSAYQNINHLVLNESEASLLCGIPEEDLHTRLQEAAEFFTELGVQHVIITLGAKGAFHHSPHATTPEGRLIPAQKVLARDTTAAGDCFVGAYAAYLAQHGDEKVPEAIDFANRAAAISVQRSGAQSSIPKLAEMNDGH